MLLTLGIDLSDATPPSPTPVYATRPVPIRAVVWDVVTHQAPGELQYLQGISRLDDAAVVRSLARGGKADKMLGFGLDDVTVVVTAAVWLVLNQAAQRAANSSLDKFLLGLQRLVRKVFRRPAVATMMPPLTDDQLTAVWNLIQEETARRSLTDDHPRQVADAVIARLALGSIPPQQPSRPPLPASEPATPGDGDPVGG